MSNICGWVRNGGKCLLEQENQQLKEEKFKLQARADKYKCRIDKAINKIDDMFNRGDEFTIIDDLIELDKILKGDKE